MDEIDVIDKFCRFFLTATQETFVEIWGEMTGGHLWRKLHNLKFDARKFWSDLDTWNKHALIGYIFHKQ